MSIGITGCDGFDCYIMNSDQMADIVISLFESAAEQGYAPADVEDDVFYQAGVDPADLTTTDKIRIQKAINQIYNNYF